MVYKRIGFRREWYTKGYVLDDIGIQKDRLQTRAVYKRIGCRREWYTEGKDLDESGIQRDRF